MGRQISRGATRGNHSVEFRNLAEGRPSHSRPAHIVILSLDASTTRGSVALVCDQQVIQEVFVDTPRGRGGALFSALQKILSETAGIKRVIVGIGPGSYNGIRSAIAVAWGISSAREIPLVGISSLLGLDEG